MPTRELPFISHGCVTATKPRIKNSPRRENKISRVHWQRLPTRSPARCFCAGACRCVACCAFAYTMIRCREYMYMHNAHAVRPCRAHLCGERTGDFSACSSHEWAPRRVGFTNTSVSLRLGALLLFVVDFAHVWRHRRWSQSENKKGTRLSWWSRGMFFGITIFRFGLFYGRQFFEFLNTYLFSSLNNQLNSRHLRTLCINSVRLFCNFVLTEIRIIHSDGECWLRLVTNVADVSIGLFRIICISIGMSKRFCDPIQSRNQFQMVAHTGLNRRYGWYVFNRKIDCIRRDRDLTCTGKDRNVARRHMSHSWVILVELANATGVLSERALSSWLQTAARDRCTKCSLAGNICLAVYLDSTNLPLRRFRDSSLHRKRSRARQSFLFHRHGRLISKLRERKTIGTMRRKPH